MIEFLKKFKNLKSVLVNHGETDAKTEFAKTVASNTDAKNVGILDRNYFFRIGPWGIIKSMTTKFV